MTSTMRVVGEMGGKAKMRCYRVVGECSGRPIFFLLKKIEFAL